MSSIAYKSTLLIKNSFRTMPHTLDGLIELSKLSHLSGYRNYPLTIAQFVSIDVMKQCIERLPHTPDE